MIFLLLLSTSRVKFEETKCIFTATICMSLLKVLIKMFSFFCITALLLMVFPKHRSISEKCIVAPPLCIGGKVSGLTEMKLKN